MGQHKLVDAAGNRRKSVNWRPNTENVKRVPEPIKCVVCNTPSAIIVAIGQTPTGEEIKRRLAKSMMRITGKSIRDSLYVHTSPCLAHLVKNWATFVAQQSKGLDAMVEANNEPGKSESNPADDAGVNGKDMGSEGALP